MLIPQIGGDDYHDREGVQQRMSPEEVMTPGEILRKVFRVPCICRRRRGQMVVIFYRKVQSSHAFRSPRVRVASCENMLERGLYGANAM